MKHVGVTADPKDIATQEQLALGAFSDLGDVGGPVVLDLSAHRAFLVKTDADLVLTTTGVLDAERAHRLSIRLDSDGSAVTWPASFEWASGSAPGLPAAGSYSVVEAESIDAGVTWQASRTWYKPTAIAANILPFFAGPTSAGFTVSASSEYPGYPAWAPCAAGPQEWATYGVTSGYTWQVMFPAPYVIEKLNLIGRPGGEYPVEMLLYGTTDGGVTFNLIGDFTGASQIAIAPPAGGDLVVADPSAYDGIRITGVSSIGPNPGFGKVEVWGGLA